MEMSTLGDVEKRKGNVKRQPGGCLKQDIVIHPEGVVK